MCIVCGAVRMASLRRWLSYQRMRFGQCRRLREILRSEISASVNESLKLKQEMRDAREPAKSADCCTFGRK